MPNKIQFDQSRARTYRKRIEVLAFQASDAITFKKSWGMQDVRENSWVIVPLTETGEVTKDIYGCDGKVFQDTYEPSPSLRKNRYRKKETIMAYQPGVPFEIETVLKDGHKETKSSKSGNRDAWIVQNIGGEVYIIEDAEFNRTYIEVLKTSNGYRVKSRDEHWTNDGQPKRILALDGGGVRGILTLGYLERIEEILRIRHHGSEDFRLCHYFDLIAGTSTGAIIASCLAKGMKVSDVRELYEEFAGVVFRKSIFRFGLLRAKYGNWKLKQLLKKVFKNNTMGASAVETGLLVVAKRLDTGSTWPMSNNPNNRFFKAGPNDNFFSNEDYLLRKVVRASTAAPSYFAPEKIEISTEGEKPHGSFVDGGVSPHNNPALLALQLVSVKGFGAGWSLDPDRLLLVSLGTGNAKPGVSNSWFAARHAINSLLSLMMDCAESVETMLQWLSNSKTARSIDATFEKLEDDLLAERPLFQYLRYNVTFDKEWIKDNLGETLMEKDVTLLKRMDRAANVPILSELGILAANIQIQEDHFPMEFNLSG